MFVESKQLKSLHSLTLLYADTKLSDFFFLPGDDQNKSINPFVTGAFGAIAGAASVFGNTPLDVIKTRMQVQ